jgi:hypothetical protein
MNNYYTSPVIFSNTNPVQTIKKKILLTLILEPQTHFDSSNYINFKAFVNPESNATVFSNTFGDLSVSDIPDIEFTSSNSSLLRTDSMYDVFLESLTTYNCVYNNTKNTMGFKLTLDNLNMDVSSNYLHRDEITIPNSTPYGGYIGIHKDKKLNYITTITPDKLSYISGKISTLDNQTIFKNPTETSNTDRIVVELVLISNEKN